MPDKTFEDVYKTNPEDETNKKVSRLLKSYLCNLPNLSYKWVIR